MPLPVRAKEDQQLPEGSLIKIFYSPRVYDMSHVYKLSLDDDIIKFENDQFIIVDKPHGVNLGPLIDNLHNNLTYYIQTQKYNNAIKLYNPHRLDSPTRGLAIIIKDHSYVSKFNQVLRSRNNISKIYKAYLPITDDNINLTIETGILRHWMNNTDSSPKELSLEKLGDNWLECILDIKKVEEQSFIFSLSDQMNDYDIDLLKSQVTTDMIGKGSYRSRSKILSFKVVEIELITGRTHQIRTQLSQIGFPILSDIMYGGKTLQNLLLNINTKPSPPSTSYTNPKMIGLIANQLSFTCPISQKSYNFQLS
ncbi:hypothetical protein DLAC_04757 [Tieghemostelium lacteum]|uniref:Pseudouridine synthase RsuA/RluA-like domain-containing protein n=1 Tax=Tieghemostelium lacteum TaxID=361077 RepID=A0A151ZKM1_TIELA|nr:hypothetical protein DLAC_04757 [Tieghemostelium lacteum]|eukprot:KYQ94459.1 hypothetical protein DLAC_04757 [Tieghemostelium lacteum]